MREILFRGKQETDGVWFYGGISVIDGVPHIIAPAIYRSSTRDFEPFNYAPTGRTRYAIKVIPETVGQFTGLTDKNGKKIFEGDIVKTTLSSVFGNGNKCLVVSWLKSSCGFEPYSDSLWNCGHCGGGEKPEWTEVVGNIHDNPELLEEQK